MKTVSVADAWSLAPIGEVRLGARVVPVPPLTFGRFQRLLAADYGDISEKLVGREAGALAAIAAIVVPGITEDEWREHASTVTVAHLFALFVTSHDWPMIADAIRFGEALDPGEVPPTMTQVTAGLLAVAKGSGETVERLTEMRIEGFYLIVDALRGQPPTSDDDPAFRFEAADGASTPLLDLLKKADEARDAQEPTDG